MFKLFLQSTLRNWLVFIGGYYVARGLIDQATADALIGFIMAGAGQILSWSNAVDQNRSMSDNKIRVRKLN